MALFVESFGEMFYADLQQSCQYDKAMLDGIGVWEKKKHFANQQTDFTYLRHRRKRDDGRVARDSNHYTTAVPFDWLRK